MEGGREQNYWPGFVDALSNVVLTLVFVLVIFVFALAMASNKVEQKMQEVTQAQEKQKAQAAQSDVTIQANSQETEALRQQLAAATEEVEKLREQVVKDAAEVAKQGASSQTAVDSQNQNMQIAIDKKDQKEDQKGTVQISKSASQIVLGFPLSVAEMDEKSAAELGHVVQATEKSLGKHKILLRSIVGKEPYSAARRLAYYRALSARNVLLSQGETPSNITTTIVQPAQPEDGRVEIIIQK